MALINSVDRSIRIGDVTGAIYQPERPTHLNPDGSGQSSLTYKCALTSGAAVIPAYLTPHPYLPKLKCYESDLDQEPGGIIRITSIYKGVLADNPKELAQHEFSRTLTEAPLETHPIFALPRDAPPISASKLAEVELALQNCEPENSSWDDITKKLFQKKRRGIESYLKPGAIYKKTYVDDQIPDSTLLARAGKVFEPGSPCPDAPTDQQYLCMGVTWVKQAGVVTITEEYQLSGPGGWDPDLYAPPSSP